MWTVSPRVGRGTIRESSHRRVSGHCWYGSLYDFGASEHETGGFIGADFTHAYICISSTAVFGWGQGAADG